MKDGFRLDGKIVLVTGAAGLIGTEICRAIVDYGGQLVMTDCVAPVALETQASRLRERCDGGCVLPVHADITSDASVGTLFARLLERKGRLDVLINLAGRDAKFDGAADESRASARFETFPLDAWQASVDVNCTGLVRVTQHAISAMLPRRSGTIVHVASTYSLVAPNHALYAVEGQTQPRYKPVDYVGTKSMVPNFTRYIATTYAGEGIRCNAIVPHGVANGHPSDFTERFAALSPMGRMCDVRELRGPFVFLASDASSYMTGSTLVVDGGWTAW